MNKKKNTKALIEVLGGGKNVKRPLGVPGWFGQPGATPAPPGPGEPEPAESAPAPPGDEPPAGPTDLRPLRPAKLSEPIVTISDGRVRFSFNQVSAAVALVALITIVVTAYVLGRITGPKGDYPYKPDVLDVEQDASPPGGLPVPAMARRTNTSQPAEAAPPAVVQREKGFYYLVIQGLVLNQADAEAIQRFLQTKGVIATIEKQHTRYYIVKDTKPWRQKRSKELSEYVRSIMKLGREYLRQGGKYGFQGNPENPWMQTEN